MVLAFGLIFVVVLIVGKVLGNLISRVLSGAGLSFLDRVLGSGFGFLRGALIVVILSTLLAVTDLPKSNEWKDALSRPAVELVVGIVRHWLPDNWAQTLLQATDIRQLAK
jgi:membrane protein required for colicin V production